MKHENYRNHMRPQSEGTWGETGDFLASKHIEPLSLCEQ